MEYYKKLLYGLLVISIVSVSGCGDDDMSEVIVDPDGSENPYYSDGLLLKPFASVSGETATLNANIINNPYDTTLRYLWEPDDLNPASSTIESSNELVATVNIPDLPGTYYYNLLVVAEEDSARFQTLVIREDDGLNAFDIDNDSPPWMEKAVIYEITPYNFVADGTYPAISSKLPEIKELGANTIWLQPVYKVSYEGQGYNVTDYFSLNPALGTEAELQQLIAEAKSLNMRVLFDIPLSQTSIDHPYAKDILAKGENSEYYDYYQHEKMNNPYSALVTEDASGFLHYFWEDLVILNYQNEEVQRWMLEACKYWVEKFDIDGYRFDAVWGVNARMPSFGKKLRTELKSIKPDILLLAEDKGSDQQVYSLGYDAAYDWTSDMSWVSQWSWEYEYDEQEAKTIFNHPQVEMRGPLLRQALFQNSNTQFRLLRFLENNDLSRFISDHGLERTKMAAALMFSIPGMPMLYNGQEIGFREHPYSTYGVFSRNSTIQASDNVGLFPYYEKLIDLHLQYPALSGDNPMEEVSVSPPGAIVAFRRWENAQNFIIILNMDNNAANATIQPTGAMQNLLVENATELKDILTNETFNAGEDVSQIQIPMEGYSIRWLLLNEGK